MLAMYLKYHKAGLTPTTSVTSTAICPVKMLIGHKSLTNLHSEKSRTIWNWYHQHARVFDWQHICYVWWTWFSTDSRYTQRYKLCSSSRSMLMISVSENFLVELGWFFFYKIRSPFLDDLFSESMESSKMEIAQ
jgi:hypothetical protein